MNRSVYTLYVSYDFRRYTHNDTVIGYILCHDGARPDNCVLLPKKCYKV